MAMQVRIVHCVKPSCDLRFPVLEGEAFDDCCPACGGPVERLLDFTEIFESQQRSYKFGQPTRFEALLDNIRSAWNVGSMLRTADGLGISHVHLCGISPTPDHPKVAKTSLGAERWVSWTQHANGLKAVQALKQSGVQIWGLERTGRSEDLFEIAKELTPPGVLVVGNEVCGIDPGILVQCDRVVHLPMLGLKGSYNVAVAFGMAAGIIFQNLVEANRFAPDQN